MFADLEIYGEDQIQISVGNVGTQFNAHIWYSFFSLASFFLAVDLFLLSGSLIWFAVWNIALVFYICDHLYSHFPLVPLVCCLLWISVISDFLFLVDQIYMMFALHSWSIWGCVSLPGEWLVGLSVLGGGEGHQHCVMWWVSFLQ